LSANPLASGFGFADPRTKTDTTNAAMAKAETEKGFFTGQLLIAMPSMGDPRFSQTVIYMCAHTGDGAMGLVLNRPIATPTFADLLTQLKVEPVPPTREKKNYARSGSWEFINGDPTRSDRATTLI